MNCLDSSAAAQFVEGELNVDARDAAEAHLAECADCRTLLAAIAPSELELSAASVGEEPIKTTSASAYLGPGTRIGRFVIRESIGHGGMGVVYRAHDPELDRDVAIKLLRFDYRRDRAEEAEARLLREAKAMARLSHPNVVTVYDVGSEAGYVFIAMELLAGDTLGVWLETSRSTETIIEAFAGAGRGLAAAHQAGLVHRDFKPRNVIVDDTGKAVVVDFGLVGGDEFATDPEPSTHAEPLAEDSASGSLTRTGAILGTPAYMAPEQHMGEPLSARTDQWAFAVCLYQALADKHPFAATDIDTLRKKVLTTTAPPLPKGVPSRLKRAVMRGLSRETSQRFSSMSELVRAIEGPRSKPWLWALTAGAIAATVAALLVLSTRSDPEICGGGDSIAAEVWNADVANRLKAGFAQVPFANTTSDRVVNALNQHFERWSLLHRETCQATRVRKELSVGAMDRAMACLDRRLIEARALTSLLAEASPDAVANAEDAVAELSDLESCRDQSRLQSLVAEPSDPGERAKIAELQESLAEVKALLDVGRPREGIARIKALEESISLPNKEIRTDRAVAALQYWRGRAFESNGQYPDAEKALTESAYAAISAGDDRQLVLASTSLVNVFGFRKGDGKTGEQWHRIGRATLVKSGQGVDNARLSRRLDRAHAKLLTATGGYKRAREIAESVLASISSEFGADDVRAADLHRELSIYCNGAYAFEDGERHARRAIEIWTNRYGPDHPAVGSALVNLGVSVAKQQKFDEAIGYHRQAISIAEKAFGAVHPNLAAAYHNLCHPLMALGKSEEALKACEQSLELTRKTLGANHPRAGWTYGTMGYIHYRLKNFDESYRYDELALQMNLRQFGAEHAWVGDNHSALGRTRRDQGRYADAAQHFSTALKIRRAAIGSQHWKTLRSLVFLGAALEKSDQPDGAIGPLEEASRLCHVDGDFGNRGLKAMTCLDLANLYWATSSSRKRAKSLATRVVAEHEAAGDDKAAKRGRDWLKAH